jgi:hypothetical protein
MLERGNVNELASALGVPVGSVRTACGIMKLEIDPDGWFHIHGPPSAQYSRFIAVLAAQPSTLAERLRRDIGVRVPRVVPKE